MSSFSLYHTSSCGGAQARSLSTLHCRCGALRSAHGGSRERPYAWAETLLLIASGLPVMEDDYKDLTEAQRRQVCATERMLVGLVTLAFVLAVGGITPFMGLPGLAIFAFFHPLLLLLPYSAVWCHLHPDVIWPLAFFITFLWPFSIPIGYAVPSKAARRS